MSEQHVVTTVRSYSSGTIGRSLNTAGQHHFVIDGSALHEEITSMDAFLAGISSCGVNLVEVAAKETGVPLSRTEVTIEGIRNRQDPACFERIDVHFTMIGPSQEQAQSLVARWKDR